MDSETFACQRCTDVRFVFLDPVFHTVCDNYYPLLGRESVRDAIWQIEYVRFPRLEKAIGAGEMRRSLRPSALYPLIEAAPLIAGMLT